MIEAPEVTGSQAPPDVGAAKPAGMSDDLLCGAKEIALFLWNDTGRSAQRRLYHQQDQLPVFRLDDNGRLYAFKSRLRAYLEAKSAEAEARIIAAANKTNPVLKSSDRRARAPAHPAPRKFRPRRA